MPYKGQSAWTATAEAKRLTLNRWIKSTSLLDGVIDFATAMADKDDQAKLSVAAESRDSLHAGPGGQKVMGDWVRLSLFHAITP